MPMTIIKGYFKIAQTAPDGDSIRFYPNNAELWKKLSSRVQPNHAGGAQLRLDAIDALETHYHPRTGSLGTQHQPKQFAAAAAAELLKYLGFTKVTRGDNEVISSAEPEQVPGFILSRFADKYGRPVSFAFKGDSQAADGSDVSIDKTLLHKSANYHLLAEGLVYPTFYSKLYPDLRQDMIKAVDKVRKANKGLWQVDKTTEGFVLEDLKTITDSAVILPKLFRRLLDYLAINDGTASLAGFKKYLESKDDKVLILSEGHVTGFDYLVEVDGQNIKLTTSPENLVFMEK